MNWLEIWLFAASLAAPGAIGEQHGEPFDAIAAPSIGVAASYVSARPVSARGDDPKRIAQGLKSKDEEKVRRAVSELAALGSEGVPYLADALEFESSYVRREALLALGKLGDTAEAALPKLIAYSHSLGMSGEATLGQMFFQCGFISVWFDQDMGPVMLRLSEGMDDATKAVHERRNHARLCAGAIGRIGATRLPALLALVAPLDRGVAPNEFTASRLGVAFALQQAIEDGPAGAFADLWPRLQALLSAEVASERMTALIALSTLDKEEKVDPAAIARAVAARLKSEDAIERAVAAAVLERIEPPCKSIGAELEPLLTDPTPYARVFAAVALREICGGSPAVEDTLLESLSADDETRVAALESIHGIDREPSDRAIGPITKCLDSKNERVLVAALDALGRCGERAKGSVVKIKVLAKHKNGLVRRAADSALSDIR